MLSLLAPSSALVAGSALAKALSVQRPVIVHLWDANPAEVQSYAIDDVSAACRNSGAAAVLCSPSLVKPLVEEQELHRGDFPGPLPVIVDCFLKDLEGEDDADELTASAKSLGASAMGLVWRASDWPEQAALEEALQRATAAAERAGLDTILLPQFGAGGVEGADEAAELAAKMGSAAALAKEGETGKDGAVALGSWDGSKEELERLREAGLEGVVLKNACRGDVSRGARTSSPSIAAQFVTRQVKAALSKKNIDVWGGAGSTDFTVKEPSMDDYFNRS